MIRLRTRPLRALGQVDMPPGQVEVLTSRPLTNMAECESFNGRLFSGGSLCCTEGMPGRWICRRTTFGQQPPTAEKEKEEGISPWLVAGLVAAAAAVGALLVRRSRAAPRAAPAPKKMLPAAPAAAETQEDPRQILEGRVGQVWDTTELQRDFAVQGFMAPFVVVNRKSDGAVGSLEFTSRPRFYFGWKPD